MIPALKGLNPKQIAEARAWLREQNRKYSEKVFSIIPRTEWGDRQLPSLFAVWRSAGFIVQCHAEGADMIRATVARTDCDRHGEYRGGITWEELQWIKAGIGYGDLDAVEIFPRDEDVVNVANMRHLWIYKEGQCPFAWRAKKA